LSIKAVSSNAMWSCARLRRRPSRWSRTR